MNTFQKDGVKDLNFYPVLGNHDYYGGRYMNEFAYSKYNPQWKFDSDFYLLKDQLKDGSNKYFANLMINSYRLFWVDKFFSKCDVNNLKQLN